MLLVLFNQFLLQTSSFLFICSFIILFILNKAIPITLIIKVPINTWIQYIQYQPYITFNYFFEYTSYNQNFIMEFVAQKLGFLKCNDHSQGNQNKRSSQSMLHQSLVKKRKLSNQESSSTQSVKSDLSLGKLKLSDSGEEQSPQIKMKNRTFISIPTPIRANTVMSKSLLTPHQFKIIQTIKDSDQKINQQEQNKKCLTQNFLNNPMFLNNSYLSSLYTPYGIPTKLIGPLTVQQRKIKVQKYLQKKKSRQWKNVKYTVRQQLAENRKRQQGRFVKSEKKWHWNEIPKIQNEKNSDGNNNIF